MRYTFSCSGMIAPEVRALVAAIPGATFSRYSEEIRVAEHGAYLVEAILRRAGIPFAMHGPPLPSPLPTFPQIEGLRDTVRLLAHQKDAIVRAANVNGVYFHHACGSGKSLTTICWAEYRAPAGKSIVVVTRASARPHWLKEIHAFTNRTAIALEGPVLAALDAGSLLPQTEAVMLPGSRSLLVSTRHPRFGLARPATVAGIAKRIAAGETLRLLIELEEKASLWRSIRSIEKVGRGSYRLALGLLETDPPPRFVVLGWESLIKLADFAINLGPHVLIMDELHKCKSHHRWIAIHDGTDAQGKERVTFKQRDNVAAAAARLARAIPWRCASSATPIRDRVRDLWGQLDLLRPSEWGNWRVWTKRYAGACETQYTTWDTSSSSNEEELRDRLSFQFHVVPRELTHANLPPKRREVIYLAPEDQDDLEDADEDWFEQEFRAATLRGEKALNEARLAEAAVRKRSFLVAEVCAATEANQKIVVGTSRHRDCERLANEIRRATKNKVTLWWAHGGSGIDDRNAIREEFMAHPGPCVLVGTMQAWGESIDLQDTDRAIVAALPYTYGELDQFEGRFTRQGQKRPVLITYIVAEGTADERVATILLEKLPQVVEVLGQQEGSQLADGFAYGEKSCEDILSDFAAKAPDSPRESGG